MPVAPIAISRTVSATLVLVISAASVAFGQTAPPDVETIVVTGISPLPGTAIDANKIAGEVETLSVPRLARDRPQDLLPSLAQSELSGIALNDEQASPFQPDFVYRGFEASPISGIAEGIAVYEDGVRLNESFGDTVNWDLIPQFAVERFTLQSNNPVFGLNAIGGAVTLAMKNGFLFDGAQAMLSGGSFGNLTGNAQYGERSGRMAFFVGVGGLHDDGFRYDSPTALRQAYADAAWRDGDLSLHLSASGALNNIGALGPTPVQLLARDQRAVFTSPQAMRNATELVALRGTWQASDVLVVSANTYFRHFDQSLIDGNTSDVTYCANDQAELCLEGEDLFPQDALFDSKGNPVSARVLPQGATPGETDLARTDTNGFGGTMGASLTAPFFAHANTLEFGISADRGLSSYSAHGELGALLPNLDVVGTGVVIDQALSPTAQPPLEAPVAVNAGNTYAGAYAIDVFDATPQLSFTLSGRLNLAEIDLSGLADGSGGTHSFTRFNPGTGVAYRIYNGITAYAGWSQSNRAPTPAELSCSNPASPCLLDAFLVSDPDLKQVVSNNVEAGLRGGFTADFLPGRFVWNAGAYRTDAANDIELLATPVNGFGYFANAGTTRHQGFDLHLGYHDTRLRFDASYSYLQAIFLDALTLASNSPAANAQGLIFVRPDDHLPLNPQHRLSLSADLSLTADWSAGADVRFVSSEFLAGDQSNQEQPLPAYATLDVHSSFRLNPHLELFGEIDNLTGARYYTYGAFTELGHLPPGLDLANPRSYSPAPGRLFYAGVRTNTD
jgi:iron complex outermembrane receptor protein